MSSVRNPSTWATSSRSGAPIVVAKRSDQKGTRTTAGRFVEFRSAVILDASDDTARRPSYSSALLGRRHDLARAHAICSRRLDSQCRSSDDCSGPQCSRRGLGMGRQRVPTSHCHFTPANGCRRRDGRLSVGLSTWHHRFFPRLAGLLICAFAADAGIRARHSRFWRRRHHESERGAGSLHLSF